MFQSGYVPSFAKSDLEAFVDVANSHREHGQAFDNGDNSLQLNQAWAVLSDNQTNFQYSHAGRQYWKSFGTEGSDWSGRNGVASFDKVVPGSYRLSAYVLGEWGELRLDNVTVKAHAPNFVALKFTPENFGDSRPVWTIGTPDRSAHEFLHGQIENPIDLDPNYRDKYTEQLGTSVQDDREFWGNWNYWQDLVATNGAAIYYATQVGSTRATNDLSKWNYVQWHSFNPKLFDPAELL